MLLPLLEFSNSQHTSETHILHELSALSAHVFAPYSITETAVLYTYTSLLLSTDMIVLEDFYEHPKAHAASPVHHLIPHLLITCFTASQVSNVLHKPCVILIKLDKCQILRCKLSAHNQLLGLLVLIIRPHLNVVQTDFVKLGIHSHVICKLGLCMAG